MEKLARQFHRETNLITRMSSYELSLELCIVHCNAIATMMTARPAAAPRSLNPLVLIVLAVCGNS